MSKPVLIIQLRPEDDTSDNEYQAILKYGDLTENQTQRLRIEQSGIPDYLSIDDYSAIIVGGSPFDISTPNDQKSAIQQNYIYPKGFQMLVPRSLPLFSLRKRSGKLFCTGHVPRGARCIPSSP